MDANEKIEGDTSDTNYIFLRFVVDNLPTGMVGLIDRHNFFGIMGQYSGSY
jgi:hypothetical protein